MVLHLHGRQGDSHGLALVISGRLAAAEAEPAAEAVRN
jgi:hypothetical protein